MTNHGENEGGGRCRGMCAVASIWYLKSIKFAPLARRRVVLLVLVLVLVLVTMMLCTTLVARGCARASQCGASRLWAPPRRAVAGVAGIPGVSAVRAASALSAVAAPRWGRHPLPHEVCGEAIIRRSVSTSVVTQAPAPKAGAKKRKKQWTIKVSCAASNTRPRSCAACADAAADGYRNGEGTYTHLAKPCSSRRVLPLPPRLTR